MTQLFDSFPQESKDWMVDLARTGLKRCYKICQGDGRDLAGTIEFLKLLNQLGDMQSVVDSVSKYYPSIIIEAGLELLFCRQNEGTLVSSLQQAHFSAADFESLNCRISHLQSHAWEQSVKAMANKLKPIEGYH